MKPTRFYREQVPEDSDATAGAAAFAFERDDGLYDVQLLDAMHPVENLYGIDAQQLDEVLRERCLRPVKTFGEPQRD